MAKMEANPEDFQAALESHGCDPVIWTSDIHEPTGWHVVQCYPGSPTADREVIREALRRIGSIPRTAHAIARVREVARRDSEATLFVAYESPWGSEVIVAGFSDDPLAVVDQFYREHYSEPIYP